MEFVAGVTHELNTPLAAIRSAGQNLADGIVTDPTQVRRYGGLIEKEGGRLTALVAQVLDFAGIESGSRAYASEPLSVAALVDEVLRDHRLALDQAGMTVERDLASELPQVRGDAAALRRALDNLVANAVKFAASGGWLAVRAASRPDERNGGGASRGPGPGHPARRARAGLRALLPGTRGGAQRDARQRPRPEPRAPRRARARRPRPRGGPRGRRRRHRPRAARGERGEEGVSARVLLVEDEPTLVLTLTDRLRAEGYEVASAETGDEGFRLARDGSFDVILLDVALPGKGGFDVLRDLRQQRVETPVLMLTARGQVVDRVLGLKLGADDYLPKPFDMMELLARIEAVLRRRRAGPRTPPARSRSATSAWTSAAPR